eukprot:177320-Amphidinium_carterae.1
MLRGIRVPPGAAKAALGSLSEMLPAPAPQTSQQEVVQLPRAESWSLTDLRVRVKMIRPSKPCRSKSSGSATLILFKVVRRFHVVHWKLHSSSSESKPRASQL